MCCTPRKYHSCKKILKLYFPPKLHKPFAATGYGDHQCFQIPVKKATHMEGSSNDWQRIAWWCFQNVDQPPHSSSLHCISLETDITPTNIENCFRKCGFLSYGEYIDVSDDVLHEQEKDDWCSLKPLGVEFDEYVSYDASVSVCEIRSVD